MMFVIGDADCTYTFFRDRLLKSCLWEIQVGRFFVKVFLGIVCAVFCLHNEGDFKYLSTSQHIST